MPTRVRPPTHPAALIAIALLLALLAVQNSPNAARSKPATGHGAPRQPSATATDTATAEPTPTPGFEDITMTGLVYDRAVGPALPISGARVTFQACVPRAFSVVTGPDGRYSLFMPSAYLATCGGSVPISVDAQGYTTLQIRFRYVKLLQEPQRDFGLQRDQTETPTSTDTPASSPEPSNTATGSPATPRTPMATPATPPIYLPLSYRGRVADVVGRFPCSDVSPQSPCLAHFQDQFQGQDVKITVTLTTAALEIIELDFGSLADYPATRGVFTPTRILANFMIADPNTGVPISAFPDRTLMINARYTAEDVQAAEKDSPQFTLANWNDRQMRWELFRPQDGLHLIPDDPARPNGGGHAIVFPATWGDPPTAGGGCNCFWRIGRVR